MPNYDYQCSSCGTVEERYAHIDEIMVVCSCGALMTRLFSPPAHIICDIEPYWDDHISQTGQPVYVESKKHREELLKRNGLRMKRGISDYR